jgi:hypothetical protein
LEPERILIAEQNPMNPLALVTYIRQIARFARAVPKYTKDDETLLESVPEKLHPELKRRSRAMITRAIVGVLLLTVVVPAIAVFAVAHIDGLPRGDAWGRLIMTTMLIPCSLFLGIFAGLSFGILTAPDWYLRCPFGQKWVELSGAKSPAAAKEVACLVVIAAVLYAGAVYWLVSIMAPVRWWS